MTDDPMTRFSEWFDTAQAGQGAADATAMTLATATESGAPSARIVLLKQHDARGFAFYTNFESRKSQELKANPRAALCFYWPWLNRQVRIEGRVEQVSDAEADAYYQSRPFDSRIGAHASAQSRFLDSRATLLRKVEELKAQYRDSDPPRPAYWSGWRVVPERMEFWQAGEFRLHDREVYERAGERWTLQRLYP